MTPLALFHKISRIDFGSPFTTIAFPHTLLFLAQSDAPPNCTELAEELNLTKAYITSILDRLERAKLVERHPCSADRRQILIGITDLGREIVRKMEGVEHE